MREVLLKKLDDKFRELIKSWDPEITWKNNELAALSRRLLSIIRRDIYFLYLDKNISTEFIASYLVQVVNDSINKILRTLYRDTDSCSLDLEYYITHTNSHRPKAIFNFLESSKYNKKVDINSATSDELESLPGVGETTATKIIQYRQNVGPIKSIDDLKRIEGIDPHIITLLESITTFSNIGPTTLCPSGELHEFKKSTTFPNYIQFLRATRDPLSLNNSGGNASNDFGTIGEEKEVIRHEIEKIVEVLRNKENKRRNLFIRSSQIIRYNIASTIAQKLHDVAVQDIGGVAILNDTDYFHFLKKALEKAKKRIYVVMFFMRAEDGSYPVNEVIDLLINAHKQGIDVRVILDKDAEGDIYKSRIINREAYKRLRKGKVDVVHDSEIKLTHSKLVLIDDSHTIIGSHNWTAGSFYAYDDKSMYIQSVEMNKRTQKYFLHLWNAYKGNISLDELKTLSSKIRSKLHERNIMLTKQLYSKLRTKEERKLLCKDIQWKTDQAMKIANILDLMRIDGINEGYAQLLEKIGIRTARKLSTQNADHVHAKFLELTLAGKIKKIIKRKPTIKQVQYWISTAKKLKSGLEY